MVTYYGLPYSIVVVVRGKAINHLHGRGLDRRTVYQSIPIYLVSRGVPRADLSLNTGARCGHFP